MTLANVGSRLEKNFWSKVNKTETCWLWIGAKDDSGYGNFRVYGVLEKAHRVSYRLAYGEFDIQLNVLHKNICSSRACIRPDHLYLGTQRENTLDSIKAGTYKLRKLTDEQVEEMRIKFKAGSSLEELSKEFNTCKSNVCGIVNNKIRKKL